MREKPPWRAMLLFGAPGCGKGTQGKALGRIPGFLHIATGEIFRQLNPLGQLGKEVARYTAEGKLVPDELTLDIWQNHMSLLIKEGKYSPKRQVMLLDGLPRTYRQAELMDQEVDVQQIFFLRLRDDEEAVERIRARALKENRMDDASEDVVRGRLETFYRETRETLSYYDPSLIVEIDASKGPLHVLVDLATAICERDSKA